MTIKYFVDRNYQHFNARELRQAAVAYREHIANNGKMFLSLAGAMSTAQIGISLAQMIRKDKIHGISCTGANLEEDIYFLINGNQYCQLPKYKDLTPEDERHLLDNDYSRVTDVAISSESIVEVGNVLSKLWKVAKSKNQRYFPHEYVYQLIEAERLSLKNEAEQSWIVAAYEKQLPLFVPGWEDSTAGNFFASEVIKGNTSLDVVKNGIEYMIELVKWYKGQTNPGFFQIGGGIAGDFAICVAPLMREELEEECPLWEYFCQISDSTTSYGSYSGAVPNEKITWNKLGVDTPAFMIESDATIVAPLIFNYVLEES